MRRSPVCEFGTASFLGTTSFLGTSGREYNVTASNRHFFTTSDRRACPLTERACHSRIGRTPHTDAGPEQRHRICSPITETRRAIYA